MPGFENTLNTYMGWSAGYNREDKNIFLSPSS
jgi:hypothetical protein